MATQLTDRTVKGLPLPRADKHIVYDDIVKGFGVRVTAAGSRSFVINYRRKADGLERRHTIGSHPEWTVAAAREEAKRLKREIDGGGDPVGSHREARAAATVADLCERIRARLCSRARVRRRRSRLPTADRRRHPARRSVARRWPSVSLGDVDAWHRRMSTRAPTHANRALALLCRMFTMAIRWGMRTDNPCKGVERNQES